MSDTIFSEQPVFDRTQEDVAQKRPKGFFNVSDWNRVVNNLITLRDFLVTYFAKDAPNDIRWKPQASAQIDSSYIVDESKYPTAAKMNAIAAAIMDLRMAKDLTPYGYEELYQQYTAGKTGTGNRMDYKELNRWEQDLEIEERVLSGIVEMSTYANDGNGTYYCGDWKRGGLI